MLIKIRKNASIDAQFSIKLIQYDVIYNGIHWHHWHARPLVGSLNPTPIETVEKQIIADLIAAIKPTALGLWDVAPLNNDQEKCYSRSEYIEVEV